MKTIENIYNVEVEAFELSDLAEGTWYLTYHGNSLTPCQIVSPDIIKTETLGRDAIVVELLNGAHVNRYVADVDGFTLCVDATLTPTIFPLTQDFVDAEFSRTQRALADAQARVAAAREIRRVFNQNTTGKTTMQISVDTTVATKLKDRLGVYNTTELLETALSFLDWATTQAQEGLSVVSIDEDGNVYRALKVPLAGR